MTPNPTTPAPTTEEWMRYAARLFSGTVIGLSNASEKKLAQCIAEACAAAHPAGTEERAQSQAERDFTTAINIISSLEKERDSLTTALAEAKELLREIRDNEVNASDEADKFLRDHVPSELSKAKARCAELTEKLTDTMDARNVAWLDLAHMKTRAETAEARCAELEKTNKELQEVCDLVGSQLEASAQDCINEIQHREQIEKNCLQAFDLSQQWQKDCELAKARAETAEARCAELEKKP